MSQFSNLVLIVRSIILSVLSVLTERKQATFAGGVQAAVLSLINDLLSSLELELFPGGGSYSPYSLGILLGILAVALNLAVAVMAAVNTALASHLSLRPEQKAPNIEARLIFCMIVLFGTAIVSGSSLILLAINIDFPFTICVGVLFLSGVGISIHHVLALFGFNWLKRMYKTPLPASSLILSTVAFILAIARPDATMWFTIPNYYFTLTYHLLIVIQNMPSRPSKWSITCAFILCSSWTACSIVTCRVNYWNLWYTIAFGAVSGLEAIALASIGIVGGWKRRRRPQMNLAEA